MIDYSNELIIDRKDEEEYDLDEEDEDEHFQDLYPNGTIIKFKCSQTKPMQFASWQIR